MLVRRIAALSLGLAAMVAARSAAAQSSLAQRMATMHSVMAKPHIAATRHTATELLTKYRSTAAGASALAAAHKVATSGTTAGLAAAGKTAGGTGSGSTQSSQPGGSSATASGTSSTSSAALDITIDPAQSLSGSATVGGTTIRAALSFFNADGGMDAGVTLPWYYLDTVNGTVVSAAQLSAGPLTTGWYMVAFDLMQWQGTETGSIVWTPSSQQTAVAATCNSSMLAQHDSRGVSTCMALVQVTQLSSEVEFAFELTNGFATVVDAAISRVSP